MCQLKNASSEDATVSSSMISLYPLLDAVARDYVQLVLEIGLHDPFYVDAYYGPPSWERQGDPKPLMVLERDSYSLQAAAIDARIEVDSAEIELRWDFLKTQIDACAAYIQHLSGKRLNFTAEASAFYAVMPPRYSFKHFEPILHELSLLLGEPQDLCTSVAALKQQFVISADKVPEVFSVAVEKVRALCAQSMQLPSGESFEVEYVTNKVWTAYNWYKGNFHSLIQLNTDQPLYLDRCLPLASHEGYPGHHVFNVLQERALVRDKAWVEYAIYPLYSPISFLSEGSANYGMWLLMTPAERQQFERDVLMPLAGITGDYNQYVQVQALLDQLKYVDELVCQQLMDLEIDQVQAESLLVEYGLYSPSRAKQRVQFFLHNRAYIVNYHYGHDCVANYVERNGRASTKERWLRFEALLSRPLSATQILTLSNED